MKKITAGLYQHYKGPQYQVIEVAQHSETLEHLVVYRALYGEYGLWVRPLEMFAEVIEYEGQSVERFRRVSD